MHAIPARHCSMLIFFRCFMRTMYCNKKKVIRQSWEWKYASVFGMIYDKPMKYTRSILIIFVLVLGAVLYLNRAYSRIYSFIGAYQQERSSGSNTTMITAAPNAQKRHITYVALGDSLTAGVGASDSAHAYPHVLSQMIAKRRGDDVTLINLGVPGASASDVIREQLPRLPKTAPDIAMLLIGVNDVHSLVAGDTFKKNVRNIVETLTTAHIATTVITIPYIGKDTLFLPPYRAYFDEQTRRYNTLLHEAIAGLPVTTVDLYTLTHDAAFKSARYYSADQFHPSDEAYESWAGYIYDTLHY